MFLNALSYFIKYCELAVEALRQHSEVDVLQVDIAYGTRRVSDG